MSRLINPGIGDLSDRVSILALKILFGEQVGKDVAHFKAEKASILAMVRGRGLNGAWFDAYTELAATNAALWHAEDALRLWRERWQGSGPDSSGLSGGPGDGFKSATAKEIVATAFRIQELNDRRGSLIVQINKDAGDHIGPEKVSA